MKTRYDMYLIFSSGFLIVSLILTVGYPIFTNWAPAALSLASDGHQGLWGKHHPASDVLHPKLADIFSTCVWFQFSEMGHRSESTSHHADVSDVMHHIPSAQVGELELPGLGVSK